MKKYLYAVQDQNGRELLAVEVETNKVSSVKAALVDGSVVMTKDGKQVASAEASEGSTYGLHRWASDDKLGAAVSKNIT